MVSNISSVCPWPLTCSLVVGSLRLENTILESALFSQIVKLQISIHNDWRSWGIWLFCQRIAGRAVVGILRSFPLRQDPWDDDLARLVQSFGPTVVLVGVGRRRRPRWMLNPPSCVQNAHFRRFRRSFWPHTRHTALC